MTVSWSFLYPKDAIFDMEYYLQKHMALVAEVYGETLISWDVYNLSKDSTFSVETNMIFRSDEGIKDAVAKKGELLKEDISRYTKQAPVSFKRDLVASSEGSNK